MSDPKYPWGKGTPKWGYNNTANASSKTVTVPTGKIWDLRMVFAELTTTASAGNRLLMMYITNGTNTIYAGQASAAIAASKVGQLIMYFGENYFAAGDVNRKLSATTANADVSKHHCTAAKCYLPAGYTFVVCDSAAIDANADDMVLVYEYIEYDA